MILITLLMALTCNAAMTEKQYNELIIHVYNKADEVYPIDRKELDRALYQSLKKFNAYPDAIAIGVMFKCQDIVGVCAASQLNIGYKDNKLHSSLYGIGGLSVGFAETLRLEVYIALCYGDCLGGLAEGVYTGIDVGASFIEGVSGFIEVGTDITELFGFGREYDPYDFWRYKTVYAGVAYNVGVGFGISGNVYYYKNLWNKDIKLDDIKDLEF